jgi:hypothetical protein
MESQFSLHIKAFNNRVKVMNQTNARDLTLTKLEAQNLQADIFELLTQIAELTKIQEQQQADAAINVEFDGGNF